MAKAKQQETVLRVLEKADGPLSARELWARLRGTGIGQATVYRALKKGVEGGTLQTVEVSSGGLRYEPKGREHHHHFLCSRCDRAYDLMGCVDGLESLLPDRFQLQGHEVVLFGTCGTCADAA